MVSESQKRANAKYKQKMMVNKTVSFYKVGDKLLLDYIDELKKNGVSFSGYVKNLIIEDMKKKF